MSNSNSNHHNNSYMVNPEVEINRIKRENLNIYNNLSVLEGEHRAVERSKTEQLRYLAKNYERLAELGEYKEPVSHICATICRELKTKEMWASVTLAHDVLEDKYKQLEYTPHNLPSSQVEVDWSVPEKESNDLAGWQNFVQGNAPPGFFKNNNNNGDGDGNGKATDSQQNGFQQHPPLVANNTTDTHLMARNCDNNSISRQVTIPDTPLDQLPDDRVREIAESLTEKERKSRETLLEDRRRARDARDYCERKKIALSPEYTTHNEPHISAISPDSGPSEAWESCLELIESYKKLADKLYRWRPPKWMVKDLKYGFDEEIEFLKPFIDEKYRKSQPSWWVVQLHNIWHGKHAAAIMNATPIDEKTKRSLTREQVGDKYEEDLKRALRFCAAQKMRAKLWWWFHEMNEKGIAKRAKELNPVLSEKSFT